MRKRELFTKVENALDMIITVSGRRFRIVRDADDVLTIAERNRRESVRHYDETGDLLKRYKIDGKPLRDYSDTLVIEKYIALLDA